MKEGKKYKEFILPNDLPDENNTQKKLIETDEKLSKEKVMDHIKGSGNKGGEKQYDGKKESLRDKTKEELYDMAQKKDISGRSEMDKEELVNAIEKNKK